MKARNILSKIFLIIGIIMLFIPVLSNMYKAKLEKIEIKTFREQKITTEDKNLILEKKNEINKKIKNGEFNTINPFEKKSIVDFEDKGEMLGTIIIPKINVEVPIYEGVTEEILRNSVGVLPKTSLPYGGIGTNSVLTGHRGTYNDDIFKNLDLLKIGDSFYIENKLGIMKYNVRDIMIINPNEADKILLDENKDLVTLVTCHPYLINNKRLVITAERSPYDGELNIKEVKAEKNKTLLPKEKIKLFSYREYLILLAILIISIKTSIFLRNKKRKRSEKYES